MAPKKSVPHFATQSRTVLSGSEKAPIGALGGEKPAPLNARFTVSVIVRRKTPLRPRTLQANNASLALSSTIAMRQTPPPLNSFSASPRSLV